MTQAKLPAWYCNVCSMGPQPEPQASHGPAALAVPAAAAAAGDPSWVDDGELTPDNSPEQQQGSPHAAARTEYDRPSQAALEANPEMAQWTKTLQERGLGSPGQRAASPPALTTAQQLTSVWAPEGWAGPSRAASQLVRRPSNADPAGYAATANGW